MTTLFDLTMAVARKLGVLRLGTATGGSATTTIDTSRIEVDDEFNGGTIWLYGTDDTLSPQGKWGIISDFVNSTGTITHQSFTEAVEAGDRYAVVTQRYPLDILITAVNDEVIKYKAPRYDATSLDVVKAQTEYTLPLGIDKYNLLNVYEEGNDDSDDNQWIPIQFEVQPATAGTAHTLIVKSKRLGVGNDFLLEYMSWCQPLDDPTDVVDESIPVPRIVVHAAATAVLTVMQTYGSGNDLDKDLWKMLSEQAEEADRRYPIRPANKKGKVSEVFGSKSSETKISYL